MNDTIISFIKEWNETLGKNANIYLRSVIEYDHLWGLEFRFRHYLIDEDVFNKVCNRIFMTSKNLLQVTSSHGDFCSGIMYTTVLFCNHGYNPKIVINTLDYILNEILTNIKTMK